MERAKILPVLKKGKPTTDPSSFRPISLTLPVSKAFEIVINDTLKAHVRNNKVNFQNKFGFIHELSTNLAVHKVVNDISENLHNNRIVGACIVDIEKAFDSVWIAGLLFILFKLGFPFDVIQLVWHMTQNRSFVLWNREDLCTIVFIIIEGLIQGTCNPKVIQPKLEALLNQINDY